MTNVKMPEPVAITNERGGLDWVSEKRRYTKVGDMLITTTQAQAYADERVREVLEEAAKILEIKAEAHGILGEKERDVSERTILLSEAWKFKVCAHDIRALFPKQSTPA